MRTFTKSVALLIVLIFTINLISCSSNDDAILEQNTSTHKIYFNDQTYQISGGFFEYSGNYNQYSMALFPSGLTIDANDYTINGGNWYLEIELATIDNTIEGTYKCGVDVEGYFIDNAQFIDDELQPGKEVSDLNKSGTLTINKLGSEYEFIYNAVDDKGTPFTAYYKGLFMQR